MPEISAHIIDCYVFRRIADRIEFLMLLRSPGRAIAQTWQAVHGKIEAGETAWQAAIREMHEETGLSPLRFWQLEQVNTFYVAAQDRILMCPSFTAEVPLDAQVVLSHEHTEFRWVAAGDALREFMWPGQRTAIREIIEYIIPGSTAEPFLRIQIEEG
ncbi:MAG: NUDIX hydrolase [Phycisphaerae bacterium]